MEIPDSLFVELNRLKRQIDIANAALGEAEELYLRFVTAVTEIAKTKKENEIVPS